MVFDFRRDRIPYERPTGNPVWISSIDDRDRCAVHERCGSGALPKGAYGAAYACAAHLAKAGGYEVGIQMMVGLPATMMPAPFRQPANCRSMSDFVRIYPAVVLEHSPLANWYARAIYPVIPFSRSFPGEEAVSDVSGQQHCGYSNGASGDSGSGKRIHSSGRAVPPGLWPPGDCGDLSR